MGYLEQADSPPPCLMQKIVYQLHPHDRNELVTEEERKRLSDESHCRQGGSIAHIKGEVRIDSRHKGTVSPEQAIEWMVLHNNQARAYANGEKRIMPHGTICGEIQADLYRGAYSDAKGLVNAVKGEILVLGERGDGISLEGHAVTTMPTGDHRLGDYQ